MPRGAAPRLPHAVFGPRREYLCRSRPCPLGRGGLDRSRPPTARTSCSSPPRHDPLRVLEPEGRRGVALAKRRLWWRVASCSYRCSPTGTRSRARPIDARHRPLAMPARERLADVAASHPTAIGGPFRSAPRTTWQRDARRSLAHPTADGPKSDDPRPGQKAFEAPSPMAVRPAVLECRRAPPRHIVPSLVSRRRSYKAQSAFRLRLPIHSRCRSVSHRARPQRRPRELGASRVRRLTQAPTGVSRGTRRRRSRGNRVTVLNAATRWRLPHSWPVSSLSRYAATLELASPGGERVEPSMEGYRPVAEVVHVYCGWACIALVDFLPPLASFGPDRGLVRSARWPLRGRQMARVAFQSWRRVPPRSLGGVPRHAPF